MILEEKLITLRKSQGLSQDDLANKLDVSRQAVYKWETGQATPDISKLKTLSALYNVSIDNLLNNNEDIVYMNTPKSRYGTVIAKKTLDDKAAEKDNTKLLPDEQKKLKTRKLVMGISNAIFFILIALAALFFILCGNEENEIKSTSYSSFVIIFLLASCVVAIAKGILNKALYPKIQVIRTYYNQELERATKELESKYTTVIRIQDDLLAWFVYDEKTNSFGLYFDGEMQFSCPINNYASFDINRYKGFYGVDIKYFDETGKLLSYKFALHSFRSFWIYEIKKKEDAEFAQHSASLRTSAILSEIKQRLDIEKSRI